VIFDPTVPFSLLEREQCEICDMVVNQVINFVINCFVSGMLEAKNNIVEKSKQRKMLIWT
jgi:hypothetical protein